MKTRSIMVMALFFIGCSSTRFVDSWKNEDADFAPRKLLVIGMTSNRTAQRIFEEKLRQAFVEHGIYSMESTGFIADAFTEKPRSREEIEAMGKGLIADGFDTVIITAVKKVDNRTDYHAGYYDVSYRWYRFGRYWYAYQDVYHTPGYYTKYRVYHVETAIYNLDAEDHNSLVWVGSFAIVDPQGISRVADDYVNRIIKQLEKEHLIEPLE